VLDEGATSHQLSVFVFFFTFCKYIQNLESNWCSALLPLRASFQRDNIHLLSGLWQGRQPSLEHFSSF
jgi:hypothetical protein